MSEFEWTGRVDQEDGELGLRWHQLIDTTYQRDTIDLIGFASDVGVANNKGRIGAKNGPNAVRSQLANLPFLLAANVHDKGDIAPIKERIDDAQFNLAQQVHSSLERGHFPIVIGGGHEVARGSFLGLHQWTQSSTPNARIGIINLDAHLDLRTPAPHTSSGTPFYQISELLKAHNQSFQYACVGVSDTANTPALFKRADQLGVKCIYDTEFSDLTIEKIIADLDEWSRDCDDLYLTVDLDVLPAATMPGVSAVNGYGVELRWIEKLVAFFAADPRIRIFDLAELNPSYDIDHRSAKVAARLIHRFTQVKFGRRSDT
jgi:formiminoglutamase